MWKGMRVATNCCKFRMTESIACRCASRSVGHGLVMLFALWCGVVAFSGAAFAGDTLHVKKGSASALSTQRSALQNERHLANVRQLTVGRKNAEAYFSFDGDKLIFQSTNLWVLGPHGEPPTYRSAAEKGLGCYQMYVMDIGSGAVRLVSTGFGGTTCGYFFPGGRRVLYSSTHLSSIRCPPKPDRSKRYRWALHGYDIFSVRLDGQQLQRLTATTGYDAEATISPDGRKIVFTSMRDGDLELYSMNLDGTHVARLTHKVGYDGGAFFSPDSQRIVYRASHPGSDAELEAYQALLKENLVEPSNLELFVMNADGSGKTQVTRNGASNFAPFFHPDGRRLIFSSNVQSHQAKEARPTFHLYLVGDDGRNFEQVTIAGRFNSFPMFSRDGKQLVWVSDRNAKEPGEFNIFIADWVP